jgi:hypothetical protein
VWDRGILVQACPKEGEDSHEIELKFVQDFVYLKELEVTSLEEVFTKDKLEEDCFVYGKRGFK